MSRHFPVTTGRFLKKYPIILICIVTKIASNLVHLYWYYFYFQMSQLFLTPPLSPVLSIDVHCSFLRPTSDFAIRPSETVVSIPILMENAE